MAEWETLRDKGQKISAIKLLRQQYPVLGLKEAKEIVDGVRPVPSKDVPPPLPPAPRPPQLPPRPHVVNQWGQKIEVDDIVGYVAKTGSTTTRRIGVVIGLGETKVDSYPDRYVPAVRIEWKWDGSYVTYPSDSLKVSGDANSLIRVNNVFKLAPSTIADSVLELFC